MAKLDFDKMLDMSLDEIATNSFGKAKWVKKERDSPYSGDVGGSRCVFVGNLPYSATWHTVKDHFKQAGKVVHCDIISESGTPCGSKGCAIVQFSTPEEAQKAIDELTDTDIGGRPIFVREDRDEGKGKGKGKGSVAGNAVFVGNLPYKVSWQDLKDHMRAAGEVVRCDIMEEPGKALNSKGCAIVKYATAEQAERAILELTDTMLEGRAIFVREDREAGTPFALSQKSSRGPAVVAQKGKGFEKGKGVGKGALYAGVGCKLFVGNLPYSATWKDLKDHMRLAGDVVHCDIIAQPGTTLGSKGCGLVTYASPRDAQRAIRQLQDTYIRGRPIWIREDRD